MTDAYSASVNADSKESFIRFLNALAADFEADHDAWQNRTVPDYLNAVTAWLNDSETPDTDWKFAAKMLYCGKIYE
jgi:hypothetical protein